MGFDWALTILIQLSPQFYQLEQRSLRQVKWVAQGSRASFDVALIMIFRTL